MLASVGEHVLSARSSTGETLGCSAVVRKPVGPGWMEDFPGCPTDALTLVCSFLQPVIVTLVE